MLHFIEVLRSCIPFWSWWTLLYGCLWRGYFLNHLILLPPFTGLITILLGSDRIKNHLIPPWIIARIKSQIHKQFRIEPSTVAASIKLSSIGMVETLSNQIIRETNFCIAFIGILTANTTYCILDFGVANICIALKAPSLGRQNFGTFLKGRSLAGLEKWKLALD